ncbi:MAG TPA: SGNH hydrolase domain-containing protein, partial [Solirubrobacteraceae bacterium]
AADIARPQPNVVEATFLPVAAELEIGPFAWYADSAWTDAACPATCRDRAPDSAEIDAEVVLLATPPCFGAAARDPLEPCDNPDLRTSVEPRPERAKVIASPFCDRVQHTGLLTVCSFGAVPEQAAGTFALIGDSHAANLKTALTVLTLAKRWRGVSILRSGCTTTRATPILPTPAISQDCLRWNRQILAWLGKHPEVGTVFLSAHATARVEQTDGRSATQAAQAGYSDELRALLRQRRRVVVIRDAPASTTNQLGCVSRALAAGRSAQFGCTFSRGPAVPLDPLLEAARALRSARVKAIDLTPHYCDATRCFAVIGGALVRHDKAHLTQTFAATLGPFILRALGG